MRWLGLLGLLVLGACADTSQTATVWQKPDGTPVGPAEMRSAMLACGAVTANLVYAEQTPPLSASPNDWTLRNQQIQQSPAYGLMSAPEIGTCLESFGYNRVEVAAVGVGSSTPPAEATAPRSTPPRDLYAPPVAGETCCWLRPD